MLEVFLFKGFFVILLSIPMCVCVSERARMYDARHVCEQN